VEGATYERNMEKQVKAVKENSEFKNMDDLLRSGNTWEVK
jgi:hypothetical protein